MISARQKILSPSGLYKKWKAYFLSNSSGIGSEVSKVGSLHFYEALLLCAALLFFYSITYLRFVSSTGLLVILIPILLCFRQINAQFFLLFLFVLFYRYLVFDHCHINGYAWFDQVGNFSQALNGISLGRSIYTPSELVGYNYGLYFPYATLFPGACTLLTGLHYRFFLLMIPPLVYFHYLFPGKSFLSLFIFLILALNSDGIEQGSQLGNNELHLALLLFTLSLLTREELKRWYFIPITFIALFKQTTFLLLPLYWLYCYRNDRSSLIKSVILSVLLGIFYFGLDFSGFYHSCIWKQDHFGPDTWLKNLDNNLTENISISTAINALGIPLAQFWDNLPTVLMTIKMCLLSLVCIVAIRRLKTVSDLLYYFCLNMIIFFLFTRAFIFSRYILVILVPVGLVGMQLAGLNLSVRRGKFSLWLDKLICLLLGFIIIFSLCFQLINRYRPQLSPPFTQQKLPHMQAQACSQASQTNLDVSLLLTGSDSNDYFESIRADDAVIVDFGQEVTISHVILTGIERSPTNKLAFLQFLTDFDVLYYSEKEKNYLTARSVRNNILNYALDPLVVPLNTLCTTRQIVIQGKKTFDKTSKGFVLKTIEFHNNSIVYRPDEGI